MVRLGLLLCLVVMLLVGCGGGGTLSKNDLQKQLEAIQSLAAEGALVADGTADARTTEVFVRVHTGYLDEAAGKVQGQVSAGRADPGLAGERAAAIRLATSVRQLLERLHESPGDRDLARDVEQQLRRDAAQAEERAK